MKKLIILFFVATQLFAVIDYTATRTYTDNATNGLSIAVNSRCLQKAEEVAIPGAPGVFYQPDYAGSNGYFTSDVPDLTISNLTSITANIDTLNAQATIIDGNFTVNDGYAVTLPSATTVGGIDVADKDYVDDTAGYVSPPATSTSTGKKGQWSYSSGEMYKCIDDDVWVKWTVTTSF